MTRAEQLARAVLDGSARDEDVKELARLVLLHADRIGLLRDMLFDSFSDGRFIFEQWERLARSTGHRTVPVGRWESGRSPAPDGLPDPDTRTVYVSRHDFEKDVSCDGGPCNG